MKQIVCAAALLAGAHALAQDTARTTAGAPQQGTLATIVVTPAPGNAQAAFDTPASVDVIPRAALRDAQLGINVSESFMRVPGVVALNRQNYAQDVQVSVRGFGARSTFGVRGLRIFVDGIPATAPDGQSQLSHADLLAADRIEVLRGPFSALYGNSSGGVISIFTADGGPETVAELSTAFGSEGVRRINAQASGQEGAWRYAMSATRFTTDGWRDHSAAERRGFNGKWTLDAGEATRVTLVLNGMDMPDALDPLGLTRAELEANPRQASPAALQFNTRKSVDQLQAGAIVEHRVDSANALRLTAWRGVRDTQQFQAIPTAPQSAPTHAGGVIDLQRSTQGVDAQWTHKTRAAGGPLSITGGLFLEQMREHRRGFQNFSGPALGVIGALRRDEVNHVRTIDPYVQGVWSGERVSVTAGLRHSRVDFRSRDRFITGANGDDSGSARHAAFTPALGAVFHASDALNLYASFGRGFETPTFNELSYRLGGPGLNVGLQPATSRQFELGAKAKLSEDWQGSVALFTARTANEIAVLSNSGGRSTFQNVGRTQRKGMEATLSGRWGEGWSTLLALNWIEATVQRDYLSCGAPPCTVPNVRVAAGNRIPGVPRTSAYAELAWRQPAWKLETALELRHMGRIAANDVNTEFAGASTTAALRATLAQTHGRWTFREFLRVDNLLGRRHVGSVIVNEGNGRYFEPAPGRTWLVGVSGSYAF